MKSFTPKVSIIIPIYNSSSYIRRCVKSITSQNIKDIEIICIDDNSTDDSWEIVQELSKRDSRIVALRHDENSGAGAARNTGLKVARGEYIGFVDSDDYIRHDYFNALYKSAKKHNADIVRAYMKVDLPQSRKSSGRLKLGVDNSSEYEEWYNTHIKNMVIKSKFNQQSSVCVAIFRNSMILKNKLTFLSEARAGEDTLFNIKAGYFANKVIYVDSQVYYYRTVRDDSLMTQLVHTDEGLLTRLTVVGEAVKFLNSKQDYPQESYLLHIIDTINFIYTRLSNTSTDDTNKKISKIMTNIWSEVKYKDKAFDIMADFDEDFKHALSEKNLMSQYISKVSYIKYSGLKVSVIIPVYNQEKYLEQCLASILNQTLHEYEVICVDDGSTDQSSNILKKFKQLDKRIKIITQQHSNAGDARNAGLKVANGKYLAFLDSDDFFEPTMLQRLVEKAQNDNADIVVCRNQTFDTNTGETKHTKKSIKNFDFSKVYNREELPSLDIFNNLIGWPWDKLFRHDFVKQNTLQFQSIESTNDAYFVYTALTLASRLSFVDETLVNHRINNTSSIENSDRHKKWQNLFLAISAIEERLKRDGKIDEFKKSFYSWILDMCVWNLFTLQGVVRKKFLKIMRNELGQRKDSIKASGVNQKTIDWVEATLSEEPDILKKYFEIYSSAIDLDKKLDDARETYRSQEAKLAIMENELSDIRNSRAYRVGKKVLLPASAIKKVGRRLKKLIRKS